MRPSSGAASGKFPRRQSISESLAQASVAAPGDGRTPGEKISAFDIAVSPAKKRIVHVVHKLIV